MAQQLPTPDDEQIDPNVAAEEEELSAGNNRLALILGGIMLVLILGYVLLPKGNGSGLASVTPSFMLDDAAVTGTMPTAADSIAAGLKKAPATEAASDAPTTTARPVASAGAVVPAAPAAAPQVAAEMPAAAAPEPEAAPAPAAAPEPAAPSSENLTGRILDENGKPLIGATVFLKGSSKATSTDANGNYSLEVPGGADNTLVYGYGGYQDEVVKSRGNQPVNVTLTPSPSSGGGKKRRR
ncbi:carboxypeptidase-like regulatory domain-containing protein [Hymenobacter sp. ASUV-10]|uniref:Carboxypeptidase-like regulatory domain-containing protein n=1 Tax=Hymenobacter aranciens TaxID=3063996 RepID=A0ABT9BDZ7_9BACT|nr:carboxypeptidase-like regulatory domain-containing protein [Hymenobacter sp. ASUV-10]MDO7875888.1 carboxypeptidase-like regulatory domain-containing protein [Hymenobacter sp. ASUV-10]